MTNTKLIIALCKHLETSISQGLRPLRSAPFSLSRLPFRGFGASISAPWGTIDFDYFWYFRWELFWHRGLKFQFVVRLVFRSLCVSIFDPKFRRLGFIKTRFSKRRYCKKQLFEKVVLYKFPNVFFVLWKPWDQFSCFLLPWKQAWKLMDFQGGSGSKIHQWWC